MNKHIFLCFFTLFIVFTGCSKTSETVNIDRYSHDELLYHRKNISVETEESPNEYIVGDLNPDSPVFITKTGKKYHTEACPYVKKSKTKITLKEAINKNLTPCSACNPNKQLPKQ